MPRIVILAGGISSRMKKNDSDVILDKKLLEDSNLKSKSMIRIGDDDQPFLNYLLSNIAKAGYSEVVIVVNEKDNSIMNYYSDPENIRQFPTLKFDFAIQSIPVGSDKPLGTADALYTALIKRLDWKNKKFTMCNSDNLYSVNVLRLLLNSTHPNAMIDYESEGLGFDINRIGKFSITKKNEQNFLLDIIEKPSLVEIEKQKIKFGYVGVSMNIFRFDYDMILPFLEMTPLNPIRKEKELPTAVKMMIEKFPDSIYTYRVNEYVPDLSSKVDIPVVKKYLKDNYD